jgi:hypothetical protein
MWSRIQNGTLPAVHADRLFVISSLQSRRDLLRIFFDDDPCGIAPRASGRVTEALRAVGAPKTCVTLKIFDALALLAFGSNSDEIYVSLHIVQLLYSSRLGGRPLPSEVIRLRNLNVKLPDDGICAGQGGYSKPTVVRVEARRQQGLPLLFQALHIKDNIFFVSSGAQSKPLAESFPLEARTLRVVALTAPPIRTGRTDSAACPRGVARGVT